MTGQPCHLLASVLRFWMCNAIKKHIYKVLKLWGVENYFLSLRLIPLLITITHLFYPLHTVMYWRVVLHVVCYSDTNRHNTNTPLLGI